MARVFLFTILALLLAAVTAYPAPSEKGLRSFLPTAGDIAKYFKIGFAHEIHLYFSNDTINNHLIGANLDIKNPTGMKFTIKSLNSSVGLNGIVYASANYTFPGRGLIVPSSGGINSGSIPNVHLTQDAIAGLNDIINVGSLDIMNVDAVVEFRGISFPVHGLGNNRVRTTYDLAGLEEEYGVTH